MIKKQNSSYITFLNLVNAVDDLGIGKMLDAIEERLLDQVILAFSQDHEILVGDLLVLSHIGSQATLHGRVKNLVASGYIKPMTDASDGRRTILVPTKQALKHYDKLSKLLAQAVAT